MNPPTRLAVFQQRLVITLKLRPSEASRLFGRLNSYAHQHPLYLVLKELGRLVKTEFLLRYIDQVELHQHLHKQLNNGESATRSEQLVADTCSMLLSRLLYMGATCASLSTWAGLPRSNRRLRWQRSRPRPCSPTAT